MLAKRFRAIRTYFKMSVAEMSASVKSCPSLWGQYEGGFRKPSWAVLNHLAELGINVSWLFTGKGPMLLPDAEGAVQRKKKGAKKDKVGVAQIAQQVEQVLASMSDHWLPVWEAIGNALEPIPEGLSLEALETKLPQFESKRISTELERMSIDGIVGFAQGRYRMLTGLLKHELNTAEFRTLIGVRELLTLHLPVFSERSGKGRIDIAAIHLKCGAALEAVRRLWRLIEDWKKSYDVQLKGVDEAQLRLVISTVVIEPSEGKST
ncbi:MAG: helix-turn-helix domain-containing protein [Myxococcota bacterium]